MAQEPRSAVSLDGLLAADTPVFEPALREALIEHLSGFLTEHRRARMAAALAQRTRWLTVVLEDIYQPHNASAVLRSCECFGLQEVHIVEQRNTYQISRDVALGASRWLDLVRWRSPEAQADGREPQPGDGVVPAGRRAIDACCDALEARGYRLVAATPHDRSVSVDELDVGAGPVAILFGTELQGLTDAALERATEAVHIPMHGFTESFNISVSAALILRELSRRLRLSGQPFELDDEDRRAVLLRWLQRSMKRSEDLIARFLEEQWPREAP